MFKKGQKWTQEEITTLEDMYTNPHYTAEQITHALGGRRWRTIQHQASILGLRRPRSDTWNSQEIALLKQMYSNPQFSREDILSAFPRHCRRTIEIQARKHHLHRSHHNPPWAPHEIATLKYMYPDSQFSREDIMRVLPGHSWEAISIQARRHKFCRPDRNPYQIDRRYFAQIDTPAKAYDLGLLAADGTITEDGSVRLWLQKRDKQLVMSVRDRIAPGMFINERRNACGIQIYSKEMTNDLIQKGIVPRKSLILEWPQKLPNELSIFFLLGYFDGDGCLTHSTTRGNTYVAWTLLGTRSFLFVAHDHIQHFANVVISEPRPADKRSPQLYILRVAGQKAIMIDRMLNASGMGLPRKHLTFET